MHWTPRLDSDELIAVNLDYNEFAYKTCNKASSANLKTLNIKNNNKSKVIWDSNPDFRINPDPDVCRMS